MPNIIPTWLTNYQKNNLASDVVAGIVVGILVIPQSLGYAVLAGLPPAYGLYAAIVPVLAYAFVGKSNVQAVGPVAITAIMTASSLAPYADKSVDVYASMAALLAFMVGTILWLAGRLKLGWIMQFISRGVTSGFISAAALLIFVSQLKYVTGIPISGGNIADYLVSMFQHIDQLHIATFVLGFVSFIILVINRYGGKWLWQSWLSDKSSSWMARIFPLLFIILAIFLSWFYEWQTHGIRIVASIPNQLPHFALPYIPTLAELSNLLASAGLLALIVFVSSGAVAGFYARKRNEAFDTNQELRAMGISNLTGGLFQSFTIAGGFSRTAINVDSGARTPLASVITVSVMVLALLLLGDLLSPLPFALLGATIMSSVLKLFDWQSFKEAWQSDRVDAIALAVTFGCAVLFGLNTGLVVGLLVSFAGLIWRTSQPHIAVVGVLQGTEHFRNINRHNVQTFKNLLIMRIDERLFFGNSASVHARISEEVAKHPTAKDIILMMTAVNHIDFTAQEMLIKLNNDLVGQNKRLNYSVIKGPVMDKLEHTPVIQELSGKVFLSTMEAVKALK